MAILPNLLLVAALVNPVAPPASAPKQLSPQIFTPYSTIQGEYTLAIDIASIKLVDIYETPMVLIDIEIVMERPVKYIDSPILVKSYHNSLSVDCANDRVFVIVGRAFDTKRRLIYTTPKAELINNPHDQLSPTTQIMTLICPSNENRYKLPPVVTMRPSMRT